MAIRPYKGCIYLATNLANGAIYIGKSISGVEARRKTHYSSARNGKPWPFSCAIRKHGEDAFEWSELFCSKDHQSLAEAEIALIASYREYGYRLYNATSGGDGASRKHTPEEKARRIGRECAPSTKEGIRATWTPERRAAQAEKMRNRIVTHEQRDKMSASRMGMKFTEEHRKNASIARTGKPTKPRTPEQKRKSSETWARKIADGYKPSKESIAKMIETKRARMNDKRREQLRVAGKLGSATRWGKRD